MKKYINKTVEFRLVNDEIIKGILIDYSDDWTFLHYNPVDYVLDGYVLIRNSQIDSYRKINSRIENEIFKIKMGLETNENFIAINLNDNFFDFFYINKLVFSIETSDRNFIIGKIITMDEKGIEIRLLDSKGKWLKERKIQYKKINKIEFNNDYINSLLLVTPSQDL